MGSWLGFTLQEPSQQEIMGADNTVHVTDNSSDNNDRGNTESRESQMSEEQKARIEANRLKALERAAARARASATATATATSWSSLAPSAAIVSSFVAFLLIVIKKFFKLIKNEPNYKVWTKYFMGCD